MVLVEERRTYLFEALRQEVENSCCLREITTEDFRTRNHRNFVWDATVFPTGSHYFPVYVELFEHFERTGEISPETHLIVETTTGNAGSAAAYVASQLGYDLLIFMPEDMPESRIQDVKSHLSPDSEIRLTGEGEYVAGMVYSLRRFLSENRNGYRGKEIFAMDHSRRDKSIEAVSHVTYNLLNDQFSTGLTIDLCALALGNGTSFTGVGKAIKKMNPEVHLVGVEPIESPWFYTQMYGKDKLEEEYSIRAGSNQHNLIGTGGWGINFPNMDMDLLNDIVLVSEQEWRLHLDRMHNQRLYVGHTSAACQHVIQKYSEQDKPDTTADPTCYFSVFYDPIGKY